MKPHLEDFNPEMTNVYDECLKGIPNETYLEPAAKLKKEYGTRLLQVLLTSDVDVRNLMIEHDVISPPGELSKMAQVHRRLIYRYRLSTRFSLDIYFIRLLHGIMTFARKLLNSFVRSR